MKNQLVLIIDFGGQVNQLIARKIRNQKVYCEVISANKADNNTVLERNPIGLLLVGGNEETVIPEWITEVEVPVLALDYVGVKLVEQLGGSLHGKTTMKEMASVTLENTPIFKGLGSSLDVFVEAGYAVKSKGLEVIASDKEGRENSFKLLEKQFYILGFSPQISQTQSGDDVIGNFLYSICGAVGDWTMKAYAEYAIEQVRKTAGSGKVLLALSGGVDSSVVAALLEKALGEQLYCIFVDHGCMRKNEGDEVETVFGNSGMHFVRVNAEARFLAALKGVSDPETKRKIVGEEFIRVFEEEAKKIGAVDFLAQGTIYPDIIESDVGDGVVIKSHHNVGGLPDTVDFKELIEPLKLLFKDEVRTLGAELGLPQHLVWRQPFPGPGLAIRIIGEVTKEKLDMLREADYIYRAEIEAAGLSEDISQYFVVLTNIRSVGVTDDTRTYDYTMVLRGVVTTDFMTADFAKIPYELLSKISSRITAEVEGVNRIVYDITSKPPATIEWE